LTLAMAMVRPSQRFRDDATMKGGILTAERYGGVRRVCVVAEDDASVPAGFQRRMASWNPGTEVRGLQGADHMSMLSKPGELSELLMEVANKYS
jgi:pimeloyl-ACP methyl ester carboxylesterase